MLITQINKLFYLFIVYTIVYTIKYYCVYY